MSLPYGNTGSLCSSFLPDRLVSLPVKRPYAITLCGRLPIVLRAPLEASVTILEATTPVKLPTNQCPHIHGLESKQMKGRISTAAPRILAYPLQSLRPILHITCPDSMISYSKGSRGLFVPSRVIGIFTDTTISLSSRLRQRPDHYTIRAGRNLPDKEFRYLRTVIVTAAVYRGFNSELSLLLLTFRHRAGVSPYTSSFDLAETCVFAKQSPGPILCGSFEHSLFRSYGVNLPSSLTTLLPLALEFSSCPPVSVCGTGICFYTQSFSRLQPSVLPYSNFGPLRPGQPTPGSHPFEVSLCLNYRWLRNINRMCIGYAFRPDLSSRLTWSGRTFLQKP